MQWPSWLTWYKKPEFRDIKAYAQDLGSGKCSYSSSEDGASTNMIPRQLRLERVLDNKTCSPMSLYDFYMYLKHIEYSDENLEFYIWYQNFMRRYNTADRAKRDKLSCSSSDAGFGEKAPPLRLDAEAAEQVETYIARLMGVETACAKGDTLCALKGNIDVELGGAASKQSSNKDASDDGSGGEGSWLDGRRELEMVAQTYLLPGSPKELNIPPALRKRALAGIQTSAHPDPEELRPIAEHVVQLLRNCSHRNFVRLGVSNGTFETVCVATGLGIVLSASGLLSVLLLALTPRPGARSRWFVLGLWPMWWLGVSLIMSGLRGSCFFLLLFARRQPLPWERFAARKSMSAASGLSAFGADEEQQGGGAALSSSSGGGVGGAVARIKRVLLTTTPVRVLSRLMIFDRRLRVRDVHLRRLQHKIVLQSLVGGAVLSTGATLIFILLPVWREGHV